MSIIQTIKKVNGIFFKGNITGKGFEMTHFMTHQPAITISKQPNQGWSDRITPISGLDSFYSKVSQNFAVLAASQIDEMIKELETIKKELE